MKLKTTLNGYEVETFEVNGSIYIHLMCPGDKFDHSESYTSIAEVCLSLNVLKDKLVNFESLQVDCFGQLIRSIELLNLYEEIT
jgi:hypothetical protein